MVFGAGWFNGTGWFSGTGWFTVADWFTEGGWFNDNAHSVDLNLNLPAQLQFISDDVI